MAGAGHPSGILRSPWLPLALLLAPFILMKTRAGTTADWTIVLVLQIFGAIWLAANAGRSLFWSPRPTFGAWALLIIVVLLGVGPIAASESVSLIASMHGCYVTEYGLYTRAEPFDTRGCMVGGSDWGPLLHRIDTAGILLIAGWPFALVTILLVILAAWRWVQGRRCHKRDLA